MGRQGRVMSGSVESPAATVATASAAGVPAQVDGADAEVVRIRGARVHNLQNIDVDLPRDRLIVITGPSGSGKSSLAFDTLFAEGQRQYIESLVGLRPAVSAPDGTARRRPDRRPATDHFDRPAGRQPEPAQHRGHGHRNLRLPAAAVCPAGRRGLLPVRRADSPANRPSRSSKICWRCRRARS